MPATLNLTELQENRLNWVELNTSVMDEETRQLYLLRKKVVDMYIDGMKPSEISKIIDFRSPEIIRLVRRCNAPSSDGSTPGYKALLPFKQISSKTSKFEKLFLEYPTLENFVIGNYTGDKKYTLEKNMSVRTLHSKFLEECRKLGIQDYEFPFSTKDNGYTALTRFLNSKSIKNNAELIKRETSDIRKHFFSTGYGESYTIVPLSPFNIVQVDGHKIDMLYSVEVENEYGEMIMMPATRAWLITVIDVATRVIIGYSISPYENYNQYDVLQAIQNSVEPHRKILFTRKSLQYPELAAFHSDAIPEAEWAVFDTIMLDNAKAHLAGQVQHKLADILKCTIQFGAVSSPETRGIVERFFRTLETAGFHRLPGTTGSNINDSKRNTPEKQSVKYGITYTDICELVEYLIAEYNTSAHSSLENQTPLQVMERRINSGMKPYILPPVDRVNIESLTHIIEERTLKGGYKTGHKPYFSYLGAKYHAVGTAIPMDYVGQKVFIDVDPSDVSKVKMYDKNGCFIADMIAEGEWGRRKHSLKSRIAANERKNKNLETNTPFTPHLTEYENELKSGSKNSRRNRTKASILKREYGNSVIHKPETYNNTINLKGVKDNEGLTKEEIELLKTMSIEEAYKRGII